MKGNQCLKLSLVLCGLISAHTSVAATLNETLSETLKTNPQIQATGKEHLAAEQALRQAKAGYLPTLDAIASYGTQRTDSPFTKTLDGDKRTLHPYQAGLSANQNIFNGFATKNEVERNESHLRSVGHRFAGTAQDVALNAIEAYLNVLKEQDLVKLAQQNLQSHQEIYHLIEKRNTAGLDVGADLTQASGRLALAQSNLSSEQANLIDSQTHYLQIIGKLPEHLMLPNAPEAHWLPTSQEQAVKWAIERHPLLKSAQEDMSAAHAQHDASKSKYLPRLDFQLNATRAKDVSGIEGDNNKEEALLLLNYNLFNGGADYARNKETAYLYQQSTEIMHRTYREVTESTQFSWNAWQLAQRQIALLQKHKNAASQSFQAYQQQFQLGKRTLLDLLDAQNESYDASRAYINGQYNKLFAQYRVLNSTNKLLPALGLSSH